MKSKELRALSEHDASSKLLELRKELLKLNTQVSTGTQTKSPGQIRKTKKTIAKILTIQHERRLESLKKSDAAKPKKAAVKSAAKADSPSEKSAGKKKEERK